MDIEKRLSNLEKLVDALSKKIDNTKYYTDADIAGNRQSITEITPYTETKTAYIGDTEIVFNNVPSGNLSIYGLLSRLYRVERESDRVTITLFEPLEDVIEVTISIQ